MNRRVFVVIVALSTLLSLGVVAFGQQSGSVDLEFTVQSRLQLYVQQEPIKIDNWVLEGENTDRPHLVAEWAGGTEGNPHLEILSNVDGWTLNVSAEDIDGDFLASGGTLSVDLTPLTGKDKGTKIALLDRPHAEFPIMSATAPARGKYKFHAKYILTAFLDQVPAGTYNVKLTYTVTSN